MPAMLQPGGQRFATAHIRIVFVDTGRMMLSYTTNLDHVHLKPFEVEAMRHRLSDYIAPPPAHRTGHDMAHLIHENHGECRDKGWNPPTRFVMVYDIKHLKTDRNAR